MSFEIPGDWYEEETMQRNVLNPEKVAAEIGRLLAAQDAAIRVLSDDRMPLQSRVNDARAILARAGHQQKTDVAK